MKNIFLTGATGVLGGYLLKTLLKDTDAIIYCLIRAHNKLSLHQRILDALMVYCGDEKDNVLGTIKERIWCFEGDVTLPQFGLSNKEYNFLTSKIDFVIHVAGKINLYGSYDDFALINVVGTQNVIQFTLKTSKQYLIHTSTYSIAGEGNCLFTEEDFDQGQSFKFSGYQKSKFEAERFVREAKNKGLKWIIVRPGHIYGDSKTGAYPIKKDKPLDFFYDIFKTFIETKIAADIQKYYDITPVDYVCNAIVYLCKERLNEVYKTFHLVNPDKRTFRELIEMIKKCGYEIDIKSVEEYLNIVKNKLLRTEKGALYSSLTTKMLRCNPNVIMISVRDRLDTSFTQTILEKSGIYCPKIDEKLFTTYLGYCQKINLIKTATL